MAEEAIRRGETECMERSELLHFEVLDIVKF